MPSMMKAAIFAEPNRIVLDELTGQQAFQIFPSGPLTFFWKVVPAEVRFIEENGEVTGGVLSQNRRDTPLRKME